MGRNKDLSKLLSKKVDHVAQRDRNRRNHNNNTIRTNASNNNDNITNSSKTTNTPNSNNQQQSLNGINSQNSAQKKQNKTGLGPIGSSTGNAQNTTNRERIIELDDKVKAIIKFRIVMKIVLPIILAGIIPFLALMVFVTVFYDDDDDSSSSSVGSFAFGRTCTTVTVTDTGCDGSASNCSHAYDGSVEFEDYIAGVVAAEVGIVNNLEYYKVAATSARTYFLDHVGSNCTVKGNATFQAYMDVESSPYSELIKQAVEETKGQVMTKNGELVGAYYASACVVNADDEYYHVRYGTVSLGEANFQKIPKEWDQESVFRGYLASWYSMVDQSSTDYANKDCPNNHDYGMSQIGALYLISDKNYDYDDVIKYYYGDDTEIKNNEMQLSGVEGFINPTRYIYCSSPFGYRIHPVRGTQSFHTGLDIAIPGGEPVYAAKSGVVNSVKSSVNSINNCSVGYGNYVHIDHGDGTSTLYAHLKSGSIPSSIQAGATVKQGEEIGKIGSTGCSTGNHLHYEVRVNNTQVDPADYLDLTGATGTCRR